LGRDGGIEWAGWGWVQGGSEVAEGERAEGKGERGGVVGLVFTVL